MPETLKNRAILLLKELRKEGINKSTISERVGISRPTLDKMFSGQMENLTLSTFTKLFKTYGHFLPEEKFNEEEKQSISDLVTTNRRLVKQLGILIEENDKLKNRI